MKPSERQVAILGAGPAGLAAGHFLASRSVPLQVFERNPYLGGLCVTYEHLGFRFDLGGHRWFTKNQELHDWFLKLMEGELVTVDRVSRIYHDGKYFDYPISIKNVLKTAGMWSSAHAVLSYAKAAVLDRFAKGEPANMKDAYVRQFGHKLYEMFFRRYSEKVWGRPCEEMSADWVSQRSKGLSILTALKDALVKSKNVISLIDQFVYPRDGYQRVCDRMAEDIEAAGGQVHLSSPVMKLHYDGPQQWRVEHEGSRGRGIDRATDVISTVPLGLLVRMISPAAPKDVTLAAEALQFRDLITVTVLLDKPQVTPDTWLYVHDDRLLFARLHEPKNWSPALVPSPDKTSVVCECFCSKDDATWRLSDQEIAARVVSDLSDQLGFIKKNEVIDTVVVRTRYAYPVYDPTYRANVQKIYAYLQSLDGLHIVGRGGTFRYNNADHSVEMGQLLAKRLLGLASDHMSVNTEKAYHEEIRQTQAGAKAWQR